MKPIDIQEYRGYTIATHPDYDAPNPFTDWGGEPPLLVVHGRHNIVDAYGLDAAPPELTREEIAANGQAIARELECRTLLEACREWPRQYLSEYYHGHDAVNDAIAAYFETLTSPADITAFLAQCWRWKGCTVLDTSRSGFCQGDYVDLLLVATPEWVAETGAPPETHAAQLEAAADLYGYWAFGQVYGFEILDSQGDRVTSCWGVYGPPDESGLIEQAMAEIDAEITKARAMRLHQLRQWITHRVPLQYRQFTN